MTAGDAAPQCPPARSLLGKPVAAALNAETRERVVAFVHRYGFAPSLAAVTVGATIDSTRYIETLRRNATAIGLAFDQRDLPADATADTLAMHLHELNDAAEIAGIIVAMPLPKHIPKAVVQETLDADKDVDGITPTSVGRLTLGLAGFAPATPAGGVALLQHYGITLAGRRAVVVGRSPVVGRPFAQLLLQENATVTMAHSRTADLASVTREAEILAVAVGQPGLITPDMVRPGAVVVDFGTNYTANGLRGDVHPDVAMVASAMAPVPGGTGPVTNAVILRNVLNAAEALLSRNR